MCDSLEEGGARCAAHTRPAYAKVVAQLLEADPSARAAVRNSDYAGEPASLAIAAHASTRSGNAEVTALALSMDDTDPETSQWLSHGLAAGFRKAEAARAIKNSIATTALKSSLRRIGAIRNPHIGRNPRTKRMFMAAAEKEALARYTTFKNMAETNKNLHAPDGWIEDFKASGTHTGAVRSDRVTAYALYRTQSTGADFAPEHYDPEKCVGVVVGNLRGFRTGDVIDEPGFRSPGAVTHEGKTIAEIHNDDTGLPSSFTFADGSSCMAKELNAQFTVYRHATDAELDQLAKYRVAQDRAEMGGLGHIPGQGWYAQDPDTGEKIFDPWGV